MKIYDLVLLEYVDGLEEAVEILVPQHAEGTYNVYVGKSSRGKVVQHDYDPGPRHHWLPKLHLFRPETTTLGFTGHHVARLHIFWDYSGHEKGATYYKPVPSLYKVLVVRGKQGVYLLLKREDGTQSVFYTTDSVRYDFENLGFPEDLPAKHREALYTLLEPFKRRDLCLSTSSS